MICPVILVTALDGQHITRLRHDADGALVPPIALTDGAGLPLGQILADAAAVDAALGIRDGGGKGEGLFVGKRQHMKGKPRRALAADAGQRGKLVDQVFQRGGKESHITTPFKNFGSLRLRPRGRLCQRRRFPRPERLRRPLCRSARSADRPPRPPPRRSRA